MADSLEHFKSLGLGQSFGNQSELLVVELNVCRTHVFYSTVDREAGLATTSVLPPIPIGAPNDQAHWLFEIFPFPKQEVHR